MNKINIPSQLKYENNCGYIEPAVDVALAACRRLLTLKDLKQSCLFMDLDSAWEYEYDHLAEFALSAGAQSRYEENPNEPPGRCVDEFLKTAAFLFYADALRQVENSKRAQPISQKELTDLVAKNVETALRRPLKTWWTTQENEKIRALRKAVHGRKGRWAKPKRRELPKVVPLVSDNNGLRQRT